MRVPSCQEWQDNCWPYRNCMSAVYARQIAASLIIKMTIFRISLILHAEYALVEFFLALVKL